MDCRAERPAAIGSGPSRFEPTPWLNLFGAVYGLDLGGVRLPLLHRLLLARMGYLGITSWDEYYAYVVSGGADGARETDRLLESLVNRRTEFFRHRPSFEALRSEVLPRLMELKRSKDERQLALWSAGCATGEEAYSLAIVALELCGPEPWRVSVLGSDINSCALEVARAGHYALRPETVAGFPGGGRLLRHAGGTRFQVRREARDVVRFTQANLCRPDHRWPAQQDVIFCHNVLIHVRPRLRPIIVADLYRRLARGGFLCFAPGEVLDLHEPDAVPVRLGDTVMFRRALRNGEGRRTDA
ncbi:MAG: CheR family methyltransferase [Acidobacteriota bacterium]|jgi:chemotaxis methyl-accepting protein methylase